MLKISFLVVIMLVLFMIAGFSDKAIAQVSEPKSINAIQTSQPPKIDGKLDDHCWTNAPKAIDFVDKLFNKIGDDQTIAYILYDDINLYVAFQCYDSQPDKIISRETKRDGNLWGDDYVIFAIDPFHAHKFENRSYFMVNAIGTQLSGIAGGRASKTEWKGDWKSAVSKTPDGWTVEMEIPFSIINYPSTDKPVTIGINFERKQQYTGTYSFWSNIGQQEHLDREGNLIGIVFPKKTFKSHLSAMAYAFGGMESDKSKTLRAGLDTKYTITSEMTAMMSISPDFSNVEQEVESIDFSYRERYYPDRRPFFQEGEGMMGGGSWSFYSRRIPQFDLGLKTYGKIGKINIGALDCIDFSEPSKIKNESINRNDVVINTRFDLGKTSVLPIQFVRMDDQKSWNHAFITRPSFRWKNLSVGGALEESQTKGGKFGGDYFAYCNWGTKGFYTTVFGSYVTSNFEIFDALIPYNNAKSGGIEIGYGTQWRSGILKGVNSGAYLSRTDRLDGSHYENNAGGYGSLSFRNDHSIKFGFNKGRYEQYHDWTIDSGFDGKTLEQNLNYGISVSYGRRENADYRFVSPYVNFRLKKKLSFGLNSQFLWHKNDRKQHVLTLNYDITSERGLGGLLVYRDGDYNAFVTYRQAVRKGIDAFIIVGNPNADKMQKRFLAKVIVPF